MFATIDDGMLAFREDHHPNFNSNGRFGIYYDDGCYYCDNKESMKNIIISSKLETLHTLEFCCDSSSSSSVLSILSKNKLFATTILQSSKRWSKIRFVEFGFDNDIENDNGSNDADNNALKKRNNSPFHTLLKYVLSNIRNVNSLEFDRIHPRVFNEEFDTALEEGLGLSLRQSNHHNLNVDGDGIQIKAFSMNNINNIPSSTIISILKGIPSIEELHFTNSNFSDNPTTIFGSQHWKDVLWNQNLKKLNLFSCSLSDSDTCKIIQSIIQQQTQNCRCRLTHLDLADNHCTNQTLYELDTLLKMPNCKLETLNLALQRTDFPYPSPSTRRRNSNSNNNMIMRSAAESNNNNNNNTSNNNHENDTTPTASTADDDNDQNNNKYWDITKMISGLSQNQSLKTLYLRGNILNDIGVSTLIENCLTNPTSKIQKLMLTDCQLSIRSYQYLVKQISNFTNLKCLWINGQQSIPIKRNKRKSIVTTITNSLRQNTSLWELYLPFSLTADNNSNAIISNCPYNNHNPYQYYLDLNQGGREYVTTTTMGRVESQLPPSLWSLVLERVNTYNFTPSSSSVLGTNGSNIMQGGGDNNNNNNNNNNNGSSSSQMMACRRINVLYFLLRQRFLLEC